MVMWALDRFPTLSSPLNIEGPVLQLTIVLLLDSQLLSLDVMADPMQMQTALMHNKS